MRHSSDPRERSGIRLPAAAAVVFLFCLIFPASGHSPAAPAPEPSPAPAPAPTPVPAPLPAPQDDSKPEPTLPMRMQLKVTWDIDEGDATNKGSLSLNFSGTLTLNEEASSFTHGLPSVNSVYTAGGVNVTYTYKETVIEKEPPRGCPPLREKWEGSGNFPLEVIDPASGSALHIRRIGSMVPKEAMKFAPPEVKEMTIDYYDFFAVARDQTIRGKVRSRSGCGYESREKDINFVQHTIRFRIPDDGTMKGKRSWAANFGSGPPDFHIQVSNLPERMEDEPYQPEKEDGGNSSYSMNWSFGEVDPFLEIRMKQNGEWVNISGETEEVRVGEKIELKGVVMPEEKDTKKGTWTVPGKRVEDFVVEGDAGYKDELEGDELKKQEVKFHWYDGGDGLSVSYSTTTSDGKRLEEKATFTVKEPELRMHVHIPDGEFVVGEVKWTDENGRQQSSTELVYDAPGEASICFSHDPLPPEFGGQTQYVQLVETEGRVTKHKDALSGPCMQISKFGLDKTYPYSAGPEASDSPGVPVSLYDLTIAVTHHFQMYLEYKPDTDGAIFVPIRLAEWSWVGMGSRTSIADNMDTSGSSIGQDGSDTEAEDFAEWGSVSRSSDQWDACP